jgi:hypothetical protein
MNLPSVRLLLHLCLATAGQGFGLPADSATAPVPDAWRVPVADTVSVAVPDAARVLVADTAPVPVADTVSVAVPDAARVLVADTVRVPVADTVRAPGADTASAPVTDTTRVSLADSASAPVVMRFGGDVLLGGYYETAVGESVSVAFSGFSLMSDADIAMVNLENPVTARGKKVPKPYNFRMHPRFLRAISDAGIDLVTIANNHIFDYGREGFFDTISYLDSAGIRHVGAGVNRDEAHRPVLIEVRGRRIGFLGYYGGGEAPGAGKSSPGVARRELDLVTADILNLRNILQADYVVVNLHWGTEKADTPDPSQQAFARSLIDAGANAVIGHHPHVLQGIESYHSGVIVYSLGNFVFGGNSRDTYNTGVFEICLTPGGPSYRFIPVGVREWRAKILAGADSAHVADTVHRLSGKFTSTIPYYKESQ